MPRYIIIGDGEYGCKDIYLGVPDILGKNGVEHIIELELDPDYKERFEVSHQEVRNTLVLLRRIN
jgi:malate dehydrogenase